MPHTHAGGLGTIGDVSDMDTLGGEAILTLRDKNVDTMEASPALER